MALSMVNWIAAEAAWLWRMLQVIIKVAILIPMIHGMRVYEFSHGIQKFLVDNGHHHIDIFYNSSFSPIGRSINHQYDLSKSKTWTGCLKCLEAGEATDWEWLHFRTNLTFHPDFHKQIRQVVDNLLIGLDLILNCRASSPFSSWPVVMA